MKKTPILEQTIFYNFLIASMALILTWIFGGPKIDIEFTTALIVSIFFFIAFICLIIWALITTSQKNRRMGESRTKFSDSVNLYAGIYNYVRYPVYSAIIFLLNPGLAILSRSWLYFFACILIYFVWRQLAKDEDRFLTKELGGEYRTYRLNTSLFFPNLFIINKPVFFGFVGILVFSLTFIGLNFASLSFRYVDWNNNNLDSEVVSESSQENTKKSNEILNPADANTMAGRQVQDDKTGSPATIGTNSIIIGKIGLSAPIIISQAKNDSQLNEDLNRGVIIYPGSVMPGESGNLFLTGHSSVYPWNKTPYGRIFATLDKLEKGDRVKVFYNHKMYEYEISAKRVVSPKEVTLQPSNESIITLMTCWPIGTSLQRLVIEGKLSPQ